MLSNPIELIRSCICFETVPNSTSPILAVPAIVLKPSGARKITSPPISCTLLPSLQPTLRDIGTTAKSELELPVSLYIRSFPKMIRSSRKDFRATTSVSTFTLPDPVPV